MYELCEVDRMQKEVEQSPPRPASMAEKPVAEGETVRAAAVEPEEPAILAGQQRLEQMEPQRHHDSRTGSNKSGRLSTAAEKAPASSGEESPDDDDEWQRSADDSDDSGSLREPRAWDKGDWREDVIDFISGNSKQNAAKKLMKIVRADLLDSSEDGEAIYRQAPEVNGSDLYELFDYVLSEEPVKRVRGGRYKSVDPMPRPKDLLEFLKVLRASGATNENFPRQKFLLLKQLLRDNGLE